MDIIRSYFHLLSESPERIDSMFMWLICTFTVWTLLFKFRDRSIKGMEGDNALWEGGEQVTYWSLWAFFPIVFRIAFFSQSTTSQLIALYIVTGIIAYQVFGRYIFDWALAFKTGQTTVPSVKPEDHPKTS